MPKLIQSAVSGAKRTLEFTRKTLALVAASAKNLLLSFGLLTLLSALAPLAIAYAGKRIIDAVLAGSTPTTRNWVLVELGLVLCLACSERGRGLTRQLLGARLGVDINLKILEKSQRLELSFFENAEYYDKLTRARREASSRPVSLLSDGFGLAQNLITLVGYSAFLSQFSAWLVLGLLASTIPAAAAELRHSKVAFRIRNWRSPESRRLLYFEYVLANDEHVKEVKIFGLGPTFLGRYKNLAEQFYAEDRALAIRRSWATQLLSTLGTTAFYGAYLLLALAATHGQLSLGNLTLFVVSLRQGQQAFQALLAGISSIYEHNLYMSNLFDYFDMPENGNAQLAEPTRTSLANAPPGICFENVGFRYAGKDAWALRNINLNILPGESLAVVGENGAGKTTLVKLLARLYEPTEGRILLDGRDLREWPVAQLRQRLGVVFQDFNQYQLRVRENVGLGSVQHLEDEARVQRAVEQGGAAELVHSLPAQLDTALGTWFEKGTELSGGQWQKIALARAFMREESDILILDEPTSALDAESEHAVFERFQALAKGRTTLVISHRFPTVRMATRIIVLENGQMIESGTHGALLEQGGKYAHMFNLQAQGYR